MDLQNCLNFQRELLSTSHPPHSYPVANITYKETTPTQKNVHAGGEKKHNQNRGKEI